MSVAILGTVILLFFRNPRYSSVGGAPARGAEDNAQDREDGRPLLASAGGTHLAVSEHLAARGGEADIPTKHPGILGRARTAG